MALRKMLGLRGEERAIACPAVHEDKGGLARAAILKGQLDAVAHNCRHATSPFPPLDLSGGRQGAQSSSIRVISSLSDILRIPSGSEPESSLWASWATAKSGAAPAAGGRNRQPTAGTARPATARMRPSGRRGSTHLD